MRAKALIFVLLFTLVYGCPLQIQEPECSPGATETRECGNCGVRERSCTEAGWGAWSECRNEGGCSPGDKREDLEEPCGKCGHQVYTCGPDCSWEKADCADEGACEPGDIEKRENEKGPPEIRECRSDCSWGRWMEFHELDGYGKARFGMDQKQVLELYQEHDPREVEDKIVVRVPYEDENTPHVFEFANGELFAVSVVFSGDKWSSSDYIDKYNDLLGGLREKYGDPAEYDHDQEYPTYCLWKGRKGNVLLWLDKKSESGYFLMVRHYDPAAQETFLQEKAGDREKTGPEEAPLPSEAEDSG
ncbi:MAG: hypothetical protein R6V10_12970 [bacterium]